MDVLVCQKMLYAVFVVLMCTCGTFGWDNEELELFDLVEEVNKNFYEVLGIDQSATSQEVRKAYRKLSLQLHPDKNKEEDAEVQFRQLVAVYEVLKDEEKRKNYDLILVNGLPDWRQPVYYYRRVRKLGLLELAILLSVIFTIGHYAVLWAAYLEKILNEEDKTRRERERLEKKSKKKRKAAEEFDELLLEDVSGKPKLTDLLPFVFARSIVSAVKAIPSFCETIKENMKKKPIPEEESEVDEDESHKQRRRQRVDPMPNFVPELVTSGEKPVVYMDFKDDSAKETGKQANVKSGGGWNHEDMALLAKAVAKFPGGTSQRWEKISDMLGRPVSDVIKMSKQLKSDYIRSIDPSAQGLTGAESLKMKKGEPASISDITVDDRHLDVNGSSGAESKKRNRPGKVTKTADRTPLISKTNQAELGTSDVPNNTEGAGDDDKSASAESKEKNSGWTQSQQKILEWGIKQYPKDTPQRWEKIAEHITGKTKEECLLRFKYLAEIIKKKKQAAS